MNTAPLKSFATWARRELITQVSARLTAVLAPASPERVENQRAVSALERDIASAGGGAKGKDAITDRVAYTWFNRIIALRFMDANGYTGIGVVSPAHGQQTGQPEILADAKRGSIDPAVVSNKRTLETITGLLDGTRPSADAQGEAYTLLLAEYCRYWHRPMPFMFEREGDYTELLIPANLLAADSILTKAAAALTEEICYDGGDGAGGVEVIGWLYQFYISERKDEVFAGFKKGKKAGAVEIPAATQLFTPHWIVRYLVENSLGRLWMLNYPSSRLIEQMDYYIAPVDEETDFLKISSPEELKIIDPACGSGHMLTYAFDLLYAIYEEEGYAPSEIPGLILTHNLYGTEIDPRAGALAAFALTMKARAKQRRFFSKRVAPSICVLEPRRFTVDELHLLRPPTIGRTDQHQIDAFWNQFQHADTFGSLIWADADLIELLRAHLETLEEGALDTTGLREAAEIVLNQAEYLSQRYHVAIANPPYMGGKQMNPLLSQFMKDEYPDVKQDLYGAFVVRGIELTQSDGLLAIVIGDTWMSIKSFEALRQRLLDGHAFDSFVHMRDVSNHPDIFGANAAFVVSMTGNRSRYAPFVRLTPLGSDRKEHDLRVALAAQTKEVGFHLASGDDFAAIPGSPIVYWLSEKMRGVFTQGPTLAQVCPPRQGLSTGDNDSFTRLWWEPSMNRVALQTEREPLVHACTARWFPYNKGGEFRKWYGNQEYLVDWAQNGEAIKKTGRSAVRNEDTYFRASISWSNVSSGEPAFRQYQAGFIASASTGDGVFPSTVSESRTLVSVLNSSVLRALLAAVSPGVTFNVGTVSMLPLPKDRVADFVRNDVAAALVEASRRDWDSRETSWNFELNPLLALSERAGPSDPPGMSLNHLYSCAGL